MTFEEMKDLGRYVANALNATNEIDHAGLIEDELKAGEAIPIAFNKDGMEFVLELNVL